MGVDAKQVAKYDLNTMVVRLLSGWERRIFWTLTSVADYLVFLRYCAGLAWTFEPRDSDIFIVSYPKSGTTVMQMMLYQILTDGELTFQHIDQVVPWFERWLATEPLTRPAPPTSPRIYKSHLRLSQLPRQGRYIYLLRNPKDACVSYYYHTLLEGWRDPLPVFVRRFLAGRVPMGSWFTHFKNCYPDSRSGQVLVVNYDDIVRNLASVVDAVSEFCGCELEEAHRLRVIERCSFAFMKERNSMFESNQRVLLRDLQFIRKGKPGDWVTELTPEMSRAIDRKLNRVLHRLGRDGPEPKSGVVAPHSGSVDGAITVLLDQNARGRLVEADGTGRGATVVVRRPEGIRAGDVVRVTFECSGEQAIAERVVVSSLDMGVGGVATATLSLSRTSEQEMDQVRKFMSNGDEAGSL